MHYRVRQGDHVSKLAVDHGLTFERIWDHPENAKLRALRRNPNVLNPGDLLFIPERECRTEVGGTEQTHRFRRTAAVLRLRLDVAQLLNRDLSGKDCELHLGLLRRVVTISDSGIVETTIPADLDEVLMVVEGIPYILRIGELDPVDTVSGQRARLRNLGYLNDDPNRVVDESKLAPAFRRFQSDNDLAVTSTCDKNTRLALLRVHGC